jgi:hypothetical protein
MSRIIFGGLWGLALGAIAAIGAMPASAASPSVSSSGGANSPRILLVRGGGGGGGGGGGHSGGGFSGGGGSSHAFSGGASPAISGGTRSFSGNAGSFATGTHSSFNSGGVGHDGYNHGGWNNGNWAWRGGGYYGGWGGWGYPLAGWLGGYGWWYPGYYGYDSSPYGAYYYGDDYGYASNAAAPQQPYAAVAPEQEQKPQTAADEGQSSQYLEEAVQSFQSGNYQNAMRMAEHAIVDSPRDAEAHEIVSLAAFATKDYRTAATEAHAVIALGGVPSWAQVFAIYQDGDKYTSQLRSLEDYVKANPKSAEGQFLLGVQYLSTGYASEAHDHLTKAADLTPKDKLVQELLKGAGGEAPATANRPAGAATK